jgi:hypothetical protein
MFSGLHDVAGVGAFRILTRCVIVESDGDGDLCSTTRRQWMINNTSKIRTQDFTHDQKVPQLQIELWLARIDTIL